MRPLAFAVCNEMKTNSWGRSNGRESPYIDPLARRCVRVCVYTVRPAIRYE